MIFNDNNNDDNDDDDDDTVIIVIIIIIIIIVCYEHHILINICLVCVEYWVGLVMMVRGLTRWNTEIDHDGYTPTSRPRTTDRKRR